MLAVLLILHSVYLSILMNINVLLELLEGVLRPVGKCMQTRMHVIGGQMPTGVAVARRQGIVRRETVQWIRKHHEGLEASNFLVERSTSLGCYGEGGKRVVEKNGER
jgi:hypothetical protein